MSDDQRLLYLEPDEEITSVVRRLRETDATRVVLVVPGRSRATASAVGLRLLASFAADAGRDLALVADGSTRALAAEAGIAVFATVADATAGTVSADAPTSPRAPIHIVRGDGSPSAAPAPVSAVAPARAVRPASSDETVVVPLPPPQSKQRPSRAAGRPPRGRAAWIVLAVILVLAVTVGAALLPSATIRIVAATTAIGPLEYPVSVPIAGRESGELEATHSATPTGERIELVPAIGVVTFYNFNTVRVAVPLGTQVSVPDGPAFATDQRIEVPRGRVTGVSIEPGVAAVGITALEGGPGGNVAAGTIVSIDDQSVRAFLRGFPEITSRLVNNGDATAGGAEVPHTVVEQSDVDALVTLIELELAAQLASRLSASDRVYAAPSAEETPVIPVPDDLVGTEDLETFEFTGTLAFDRPYVMRAVAEEAALTAFAADLEAVPAGMSVVPESVTVVIGAATLAADALRIEATVAATAVTDIDEEAIRQRAAGLTVDEALTQLAELGELEIKLWPAWVDHVPALTMRITVLPVPPEASESPGESPR